MKNKLVLSIYAVIFFVCLNAVQLSAQTAVKNVAKGEEDWRYLKLAQDSYENAKYGEAITYAEQAKINRKQNNDWKIYTIENTLRLNEVRKVGDLLEDVIPVLKDRNQKDAVSILEDLTRGRDSKVIDGKLSNALEYLEEDYYYPEADFLIGKIYLLEGEINLAYSYMNEAYAHADKLDVMDERYDILYSLASLSYDNNRDADYEKYLLLVIKDDGLYMDNAYTNAMLRIVNENKKESVEKFFLLYRSENYNSIDALEKLAVYYERKGEQDKALKCVSLASVTSFTKIANTIKSRSTDYSYISFENTMTECQKYPDIISWGNSKGVWELYYNFAVLSRECGKDAFARELLGILSRAEPIGYYRVLAQKQLSN